MAKKVKKPKVKDLEPKAGATENVKGGCLYHMDAQRQAEYYAGRAEDKIRKTTTPR